MNILVVSTVRYRANGISNVIRNLFSNDFYLNEKVSFVFPTDNDPSMINELKLRGYKIYEYPRYEKNRLSYLIFLYKLIKKNSIDIIHVHGNSHALVIELIAALMGGCKNRICHSHNTTCNSILFNKLLSPIFNLLCTNGFACGVDAGKWMFGNKKFQVINNGINIEKFKFSKVDRRQIRDKYSITEDYIVLGNVGNLNAQKNQIYILDILASLNSKGKYKLMLIGEGEKKEEILCKAKELNLTDNVIFVGVTDKVSSFLAAIDIIIMPSLYEGLPLSLIEEQANGLPCIVSNVITKEVNLTEMVYFSSLNDVEEWVNKIDGLDFTNSRTTLSEHACKRISDSGYDIVQEASKLKKYYDSLV